MFLWKTVFSKLNNYHRISCIISWAKVETSPNIFLQPACKPDSVPVLLSAKDYKTGFHHLSCPGITARIIRPTPRQGRAALKPVYMVFQPIRRTAPAVASRTGELLPHLFTLIPSASWRMERLFSVTLLYPRGYLPVRKHGALCWPDFPWRLGATMERPAALQKYDKYS